MAMSPTRRPAASTTAPGRFARPGTSTARTRQSASGFPKARPGRRPQPPRRGIAGGWVQRGRPQQSGMQKALGKATSRLPQAARRRSSTPQTRKGGKAGGLALLAGVAGLAFKNRDKLTTMLERVRSKQNDGTGALEPETPTTPSETATPSVADATDASETPPSTTGAP